MAFAQKKYSNNTNPIPLNSIITRALQAAAFPTHILYQGGVLLLSFAIFAAFFLFAGVPAAMITILSFAAGYIPFSIFVALFGMAVLILGITAINAFLSGVQYHLAMQAVSGRKMDIDMAWKLSSARWKDAFVLHGVIAGLIVLSIIIAGAAFVVFNGGIFPTLVHFFTTQTITAFFVVFLAVGGVFFFLQPFLMILYPMIYFEDESPLGAVNHVRQIVRGRYVPLFVVFLVLAIISGAIHLVSHAVGNYFLMSGLSNPLLVGLIIVGWLVRIVVFIFGMAFTFSAQSLVYLHVVPQPARTHFVSKGMVSRTLSRLAKSKPEHSPHLPVQWKQPRMTRKKKR